MKPLAILWAIVSRSGNIMPLTEDRRTLFTEEYAARKQMLPGDRMSRVWVFDDDPRVTIDSLSSQLSEQRLKVDAMKRVLRSAIKLPRPWMMGNGLTWPEWDSIMADIEKALDEY